MRKPYSISAVFGVLGEFAKQFMHMKNVCNHGPISWVTALFEPSKPEYVGASLNLVHKKVQIQNVQNMLLDALIHACELYFSWSRTSQLAFGLKIMK